jgi:predicted transcriptional regulator of viral defense system
MKLIKRLKHFKAIPFTHSTLLSHLSDYKNPNDKIKQMVKHGELIRVKQSLYVLSDIYHDKSVSKELLANLIYGPSYISMDYALSFYDLIPERVYEITSVTTKMVKDYDTPFGRFSYIKSPINLYSIGITIKENEDKTSYMIATPQKALCDKVLFTKSLGITSIKAMIEYLRDDLRIDFDELKKLDLDIFLQCVGRGYKCKLMEYLYKAVKKVQES